MYLVLGISDGVAVCRGTRAAGELQLISSSVGVVGVVLIAVVISRAVVVRAQDRRHPDQVSDTLPLPCTSDIAQKTVPEPTPTFFYLYDELQ